MLHFNIALYHLFSLASRIVSLPASAFNLRTTETFFCAGMFLFSNFIFFAALLLLLLVAWTLFCDHEQRCILVAGFVLASLISHGLGAESNTIGFTFNDNSWWKRYLSNTNKHRERHSTFLKFRHQRTVLKCSFIWSIFCLKRKFPLFFTTYFYSSFAFPLRGKHAKWACCIYDYEPLELAVTP